MNRQATHCSICGRALTDPQSLARGAGPVCFGKTHGPDVTFSSQLSTVARSIDYDIELVRDGRGGEVTNVPWSVVLHSPDGFTWGDISAGAADLALNILNAFVPPGSDGHPPASCFKGYCSYTAYMLHHDFKFDFLRNMPKAGGVIKAERINNYVENRTLLPPPSQPGLFEQIQKEEEK